MMKKIIVIACLFLSSFYDLSATRWKVFVYMDSGDDLADMAFKNITSMMRAQPSDAVDFFIQLHAYDMTALRYQVSSKGLLFLEEVTLTGNSKQDFTQAAAWAFAQNNADYTMLIAWDHGWGILDPQWNEESQRWEMENDPIVSNACSIKRSLNATVAHQNHKGFIFTVEPRAYLTNQDLVESLQYIQEKVLNGKKLDVLAFDTCMGAMIEVAYQIAPYAHYFVGNQTCSMRDGFNYPGIIAVLNQEPSPKIMAQGMVNAFNTYYDAHDQSGIYTHTALELQHVYRAKEALDAMIQQLVHVPDWQIIAFKACEQTPRVCLFSMYPDLVFYGKKIEEQLIELPQTDAIIATQHALHNFYDAVSQLVVAHCGGSVTHDQTYGVAVYQPFNKFDGIDSSYYKTLFGRESQWITLLEHIDSYAKNVVCKE